MTAYDVGRLQLGCDVPVKFLSGRYATIMSNRDYALMAKCREVLFKLIA